MAAEIRTAKSARHGPGVITIHFPRSVFPACGSSQIARAGTHRSTNVGAHSRGGTGHRDAQALSNEPFLRKLLTSDKRCRAVLKLVIDVVEERAAITIQKEK
jgi:hypothetical protein